jgi:hypothetical protein
MMSAEKLKALLMEVSLGREDVVELLSHLIGKKLTFWEIMEEASRLRGRLRHYFRDTYYIHGRPFCPLLERDIGMLVAIGILLPQKDKETFVVSPEFLPSWPIG